MPFLPEDFEAHWLNSSERIRIPEISFAGIQEFRTLMTRHDTTEESFAAGIHLVPGVIATI